MKIIDEIISKIRTSNRISNNSKIAGRIYELNVYVNEKNSEICIESLENFYRFLMSNDYFDYPDITLTPSNDIYATYKKDKIKLFSIHFKPDKERSIVVFAGKGKWYQIN